MELPKKCILVSLFSKLKPKWLQKLSATSLQLVSQLAFLYLQNPIRLFNNMLVSLLRKLDSHKFSIAVLNKLSG